MMHPRTLAILHQSLGLPQVPSAASMLHAALPSLPHLSGIPGPGGLTKELLRLHLGSRHGL